MPDSGKDLIDRVPEAERTVANRKIRRAPLAASVSHQRHQMHAGRKIKHRKFRSPAGADPQSAQSIAAHSIVDANAEMKSIGVTWRLNRKNAAGSLPE